MKENVIVRLLFLAIRKMDHALSVVLMDTQVVIAQFLAQQAFLERIVLSSVIVKTKNHVMFQRENAQVFCVILDGN